MLADVDIVDCDEESYVFRRNHKSEACFSPRVTSAQSLVDSKRPCWIQHLLRPFIQGHDGCRAMYGYRYGDRRTYVGTDKYIWPGHISMGVCDGS